MSMRNNPLAAGKENRLFVKILFYFLSLLIPIIITGVSTYMYSVQIMKKDFNERIKTNLQNAAGTMDANLESIQETSLDFFNDDMVHMLLMPKEQMSLEVRTEIWRLPRIIQRNENIISDFTDRMFVFIDDKDVYVSGGVNQFQSFFGKMYKYDKYDAAYWAEKLKSDKYIELLPAAAVKREGIHDKQVVPIVIMDRIQDHTAVMVLNVAVEAIENVLKGSAVFGSTQYVVVDGNGQPIYDPQGYTNDPLFSGMLRERKLPAAEMELMGNKYEVARAESGLYGWEYYSLTPAEEFARHTRGILQMTLILCLVLVVMGAAFAFIFSYRIYNPIRNIRNILLDQSELWNDSGKGYSGAPSNEFEQIQLGIRGLADRHLNYKMKYDRNTSDYVESSFLFLLKGHTLNQEEILRETLRADFGFDRKGFVCCAVHFDLKEAFYESIPDTDRINVMNGVKKIVWTLLGRQAPAYVLEYRQNLFVGIVNADAPADTKLLHRAFRDLLDIFRYDIHMYYDLTVGIGTFYEGINEIGVSYNEAMTAIGKRSAGERFQIVDSEQLRIEHRFLYSFFDEQKILNHLKLGNAESLPAIIEDIVASNMREGISYEYLQLLFKELQTTGIRYLAERGVDIRKLPLGSLPGFSAASDRTEPFAAAKELQGEILSFYRQIIEATKQENSPKSGSLVTLIEKYIEENYTKDLGLEQIAGEMGVSVKYVSRVFKEKTGVNLTDFINQVRMEKAKGLLAETDMRVNDIAEAIGIPSRTTFLRVFKKMEGVSPNEYRTIHRNHMTS
ncbi:helix-turn-helix domain-containing protein [Paenibacillus hamazuiensis]|uniref:helix-turn-helix domain-containing protein n=1 Tax=Paenibacillus hamazuiensis TaxID=2936508 RepID=UPI00200DBD75|nr:helix-turn-helix domain-containing protein [Paenibacillus hamazuiensis]